MPNDPRGSLSRELRNAHLGQLGEIHYGRKRHQPTREEIKAFHAEAKKYLEHPVLWFESPQRQIIGEALGSVVGRKNLTCYACAALPDHAHLLVRRHRIKAQEMIELLMAASRDALVRSRHVPPDHPVWSRDYYVKYKDTPRAVHAAADYIHRNFAKHRIAPQEWEFVVPYDNWPFHKK